MPNPFYTAMMGNAQNFSPMAALQNLHAAAQQFKANPLLYLAQRKMNVSIPENITHDPNAILQHLVNTGQVNPSRVEAANQKIFKMGGLNNYGR